jgi:hypothetical protein
MHWSWKYFQGSVQFTNQTLPYFWWITRDPRAADPPGCKTGDDN